MKLLPLNLFITDVLANTDVNRILLKESSYAFTSAETCALSTTSPSQARLFIKSGNYSKTLPSGHSLRAPDKAGFKDYSETYFLIYRQN